MLVPNILRQFSPTGDRFTNTDEFRGSAIHFEKYGWYIDAPEKSKQYLDYWNRETDRCKNGYVSPSGIKITGNHYFYLNYTPMLKVEMNDDLDMEGVSADKVEGFPNFWDGDYYFFHALDLARRLGKHLIILKARGKGYSYKCGSILARNYHLVKKSKGYAFAFEKEYLTKDGLLNKASDTIAFNNTHCVWRQPSLIDKLVTDMHKKAGYKSKVGGSYVERGRLSEVIGVSLKDNPQKARGKRGKIIMWEEAGKFPGLFQAFDIARPSVEQGRFATGIMIVFGTGGTEEADYASLEELFYHPEANNCLEFNNIWDDGTESTKCGLFIPAYTNYEGFIDDDGNSDSDGAREFLDTQRELRKKSKNSLALEQFVSEFPFNPREATLNANQNLFPIKELQDHLNSVLSHKRYNALSTGYLYRDRGGSIKFTPDVKAVPVFKFPTPDKEDKTGCIFIKESPIRDRSGKVPQGLYVLGHDPYAHDDSTTNSLGACYVIKMTNNFSLSLNDCIVAGYVGRPSTQDEYNKNMFILAEYYGCKIGFENDRGDVIGYGKRHRLLHLLEEEFRMLDKRELASSRVRRPYGMHMTNNRKLQGEVYIRDWLNAPYQTFEDGTTKLILHTILDPGLLSELIKFNHQGNFDRVMALMIAMYYQKEFYTMRIVSNVENKFEEFIKRDLFPQPIRT